MTDFCPTCCTRNTGCEECHAQEIAKRNEEIADLKANNKEMGVERFELMKEISTLRKALEAMEDCDNCKHSGKNIAEYPCNICDECSDKWELAI